MIRRLALRTHGQCPQSRRLRSQSEDNAGRTDCIACKDVPCQTTRDEDGLLPGIDALNGESIEEPTVGEEHPVLRRRGEGECDVEIGLLSVKRIDHKKVAPTPVERGGQLLGGLF